jgi:uncharacterized cupredoxin-like copper-binding protein
VKRFLVLAALAIIPVVASACSSGNAEEPAVITFHFTRFVPDVVTGKAGVPLTITLRNDDPIEHEWIVGPPLLHDRHRTGTEPYHDELPTEVTVPALSTRVTTVTFDQPGDYPFICHLPGHEAYGMRGTLRIVTQ